MIVVVLPFCNRDAGQMLTNLQWQSEISVNDEALLSYDKSTLPASIETMRIAARKAFKVVKENVYDLRPGIFPPNAAWQSAAWAMARGNKPWLWLEADCIPLCPGWLTTLDREYTKRKQPFMGHVVPLVPPHLNGVAVYPANAANLCQRMMIEAGDAFDVVGREEVLWRCHDASSLMSHAWSIQDDGKFHVFAGGQHPTFKSRETLRQIPPTAVMFHRCKDGTLINLLRECKRKI